MAKRKAKTISPPRNNALLLAVILGLLIVIAGLVLYVSRLPSTPVDDGGVTGGIGSKLLQSIGLKEEPSPIPSPSPTTVRPVKPLPHGRQTGQVSGKFVGPNITQLTVDPVDAQANQEQTIEISLKDNNPVTKVTATVKLDSVTKTTNLSLISGSQTEGIWSATATFPEGSLDKNYTITIEAVSASGTSQATATFR